MDCSGSEPRRRGRDAADGYVGAIDRGVRYLAAAQEADGAFPSLRSVDPQFTKWVPAGECFVTLYILCALRHVQHRGLRGARRRASHAALKEMTPAGLWRFLTTSAHEVATYPWPLDADSTTLGSMALRHRSLRLLLRRNAAHLLKWRDDQGRFLTWIEEMGYINPVCAGTNANVVWYLGEAGCTVPVIGWLIDIVTSRTDQDHQAWYPGAMHVNYLVSRAAYESAPGLRQVNRDLEARVVESLGDNVAQCSDLSVAQALCTLVRVGAGGHRLVRLLADRLVEGQLADGSWPAAPAYGARLSDAVPDIPVQPMYYWGSPALTTGVALEALALVGSRFRAP